MRLAFVILLLAATSAVAQTEIHRCPLEDGTFSFQEMPCPEPAASDDEADVDDSDNDTSATDDYAFDTTSPFDEPDTPPEPALPEPVSQDRAECEKTTRDAIDAVDLRMRRNPAETRAESLAYVEELRVLTQQLRACKQL